MTDRQVIVIGAGLTGLATGIYARRCGYPCRIVEQHSAAGGVAASWRRKDFLIDGGIHFIMGTKPGHSLQALYGELGLDFQGRFVEMRTYGRYIDENKGRRIEVTQDLDRLARDLKGYSGDDAPLIDVLVKGARRLRGLDLGQLGLSRSPEMAGEWGRLEDLWKARRAWKYLFGKCARSMADFTRRCSDPWLRPLLNNLFLPDVPVWFVCLILALLAEGDLGYLKNGCQDLVQSLRKNIKPWAGNWLITLRLRRFWSRTGGLAA